MFCKQTYVQSNDDILFNIKALLCINSGLLQMKATPRVRKIALLGKFAYPELRLLTLTLLSDILSSH
ncbi:hypothetical protein PCIT_a0857 [Pseudoalteromonas citrea]|uniref:Uncharacterized protein n=2 Tax=Pseudoalteromonas citrea TaxID=43655 RepID=A0AAD4FTA4_9GAMM|nr:hypothetical protein PCIT_a0857 [Pseudoalteromonas citrea]